MAGEATDRRLTPIELHAAELSGVPGWLPHLLEHVGKVKGVNVTRATGSVPVPFKGGPRKGRPNWGPRDREKTLLIAADEHDAWLAAWEARTGNCRDCGGSGRRYSKPCARCGGAGVYPAPNTEAT